MKKRWPLKLLATMTLLGKRSYGCCGRVAGIAGLTWVLALVPATSFATPITFSFAGTLNDSNALFNAGDTFNGTYTFESTAPVSPTGDFTIPSQSVAGTSWMLSVASTATTPFSLAGTTGVISWGNNTAFGDRYIATLFGATLPMGTLNYFQIDLQDQLAVGANMLSTGVLGELPLLSLTSFAHGRFFVSGLSGGCTQCSLTVTSLQTVPEALPGSAPVLALLSLGLIDAALRARGRKKGVAQSR